MDFFNLMPYLLFVLSLTFLSMALFVFFRKKPLILNSRWFLVIVILCFLPQMLLSIQMSFKDPLLTDVLPFLMYGVLIVMFVIVMRGFSVFGVDGTDFQRLFVECLNDKNYEYDQTLSSIKIKNPELELSVAIQSWIGTAQVRYKGKGNREVLNDIIKQLKSKEIKANFMFPVFYLLIGAIMAVLSISMISNVK